MATLPVHLKRRSHRVGLIGYLATIGVLVLGSSPGLTQTNFHILATNGPASNRMAIVFLAEGFTSGQTNLFLDKCTNAMNALVAAEPFQEFQSYLNFYAIFVPSVQSGSDRGGQMNNTYFNSVYEYDNGLAGYIIIPTNSTGQGKVDALMNSHLPTNQFRYRLPVMLVNEPMNGGSGGQTCIVAAWSQLGTYLLHEFAHSFAGLGDEYDDSGGLADASAFGEEPNTTQQTNRNLIKWNAWISTNTPVPTPDDPTNASVVGLFEGAHYSPTNWYRPKSACLMRYVLSGFDYCEVCREALVKTFYAKVRAIDAASPTNASLTLTTTQAVTFGVSLLQPLTHTLSVQWQTNGVNVSDATNATFNFNPATVTNGIYSLRAIVHDDTAWVRNDPAGLLYATNTWNVTVAVPQLWLESPQVLAGGQFRFTVRGGGVTNFTIKASTNLTGWSSISTNALSGGLFNFTNSGLTNIPRRFYRAVAPPQ